MMSVIGPSLHLLQNSNLSAIVQPGPGEAGFVTPPLLLGIIDPRRLPSTTNLMRRFTARLPNVRRTPDESKTAGIAR